MLEMTPIKILLGKYGGYPSGLVAIAYSVVCCAVAAAVERRRVHVLRRHDLLDLPDDGQVPMSAAWLIFQSGFLATVELSSEYGLSSFLEFEGPESMKRYTDCLVDGVTGLGFICAALSVYVVGNVSDAGDSKSWFQYTLNKSRLDRYYWVLTTLCSINLIWFLIVIRIYPSKMIKRDGDEDDDEEIFNRAYIRENAGQYGSEACCIKKGSALELMRHYGD